MRETREKKKVAVQGSPACLVQTPVGGHHCDGEVCGGEMGRIGPEDAVNNEAEADMGGLLTPGAL